MTDREIAKNTDDQLLLLMRAVVNFINGTATLNELKEAEGKAEMYRCWEPLAGED